MENAFLLRAEKALAEKSMFWAAKPNYEVAVDQFNQAANLYKANKRYTEASQCFIRAAQCYYTIDSLFLAAKAYENAAIQLSLGKIDAQQIIPIYRKAADLFALHGVHDRACEMLEKAAGVANGQERLKILMDTLELYRQEDRLKFSGETFKKSISCALQLESFPIAQELSQELELVYLRINQQSNADRQSLVSFIIHLFVQDSAIGSHSKISTRNPRVLASHEGHLMQELLLCYEKNDTEAFSVLQNGVQFNYIDPEVIKLVKKLPFNKSDNKQEISELQREVEEEGYC